MVDVPAVVLWHEPAGGAPHFDWMIARTPHPAGDDDRCLLTYRTSVSPPEAAGAFEAIPIEMHRARYLWYEGALSDGRGTVRRVWAGRARVVAGEGGPLLVEMYDGGKIVRIVRVSSPAGPGKPVRFRVE